MENWISAYANEFDLQAIEQAVAAAEKRTSGEIVPMVVRESSLSGHVPVIGALLAFAFLMVVLPLVHLPGPAWIYDVVAVGLSFGFGFVSAHVPVLRRLFTSSEDLALSVLNRAQLEFHQTGIPQTEGRTGVLIFVSLLEHRAVILGDESISAKLNKETWVEVVDGLLACMKERDLRAGYVEAIGRVGDILAREFPIQPNDVNELPNTLVVKN